MKKESYSSEALLNYLKNKKIATIDELKIVLKTQSRMTVFRKLKTLDYISSCSHSGKYYSLKEIAEYNKSGIWLHGGILFSKYETLKETLKHLIYDSPKGYAASELHNILQVKVDDVLLELTKDNIVIRQKISGVYIYYSPSYRKKPELIGDLKNFSVPDLVMDNTKAALIIFFSTLNEKQRRLYAGLESSKIGHGGDKKIAELLGLNEKTVAKGRKELLKNDVNLNSVRKKGGGRNSIGKKSPNIIEEISILMEYETAGDPMSGMLWTKKTREKISKELAKIDIKVGPTSVGKILKQLNYSLKCNSKKISNGGKKLTKDEKKARDMQFKYINKKREEYAKNRLPIISVDAKKKELIGNFKNSGTRYKKEADLTNDHDFITYAKGKAFIYGLFDSQRLEGFVYVGQSLWDKKRKPFTSSETPEFAAEMIAKWWKDYRKTISPDAHKLLIIADAGVRSGYRAKMWKFKLSELGNKFGLTITVCHYPPGASKWNPIEHRLFSEISNLWQGAPLKNFETVLKYIRTTKTGLTVRDRLVTKQYKKGKSVSKNDERKDQSESR